MPLDLAELYWAIKRTPQEGTLAPAVRTHAQACGIIAYLFDLHPDEVAALVAASPVGPGKPTQTIHENDLRMEAYGTNDPVHGSIGVAILHVPTGMTEACDTERSRIANTVIALQKLSERLAQTESEDRG